MGGGGGGGGGTWGFMKDFCSVCTSFDSGEISGQVQSLAQV